MVEKSCGRRLKALRSDNGGEYTGRELQDYLKAEGVHHELTVQKPFNKMGLQSDLIGDW